MHNILLIAKRDYLASVRTKAFLIGLLVAPILFGGSFTAMVLLKGHPDTQVRHIALVDRTGIAAPAIIQAVERQHSRDKQTSAQIAPKYAFEISAPDLKDPDGQRLALSNRVRTKELFAFLEIGATSVQLYSNQGGFGELERWLGGPVNDALRRTRLAKLGLSEMQLDQALQPIPMDSMNLVTRDRATGRIVPARKRGMEGFAGPFVLAILFFMIVLLTSAPMLAAVAEDKAQRVFEMLLASATPLDLISGKVLAAVGVALTSSIFYVIGAFILLQSLAILGLAPLHMVPWFFVYLVAEVVILASMATALGAACSSTRDAENLKMLLIMPVMIPLLLLTPILQQPNGTFATALSFFPLFTPILMMVRQASPSGVPAWQPWLGLIGILAATLILSWMASRVFRIAILFQGKTPNPRQLLRWGLSD